jgi:hypothetical protein
MLFCTFLTQNVARFNIFMYFCLLFVNKNNIINKNHYGED